MSAPSTEADVRSLQRRAEQALRAARPRDQILRLLRELLAVADEGSDAARFAHRHLAELSLEENPWGAALHLRRVLQGDPDDDAAHALMGLCQALQGNFRMAVSAYRRAISLTPANPWYNHNLGHLLDVALDQPREALGYLRRAHRAAPDQEEVGASLAHCLGRMDLRDEALVLARALLARHPRHKDLKSLLTWLETGADGGGIGVPTGLMNTGRTAAVPPAPMHRLPATPAPRGLPGGATHGATAHGRPGTEVPQGATGTEVETALERAMTRAGCPASQIARARSLVRDYASEAAVAGRGSVAVLAAAVEYALARVDGARVRQRDVAERHGVSVSSLSTRYAALRSALKLVPGDARYASRSRPG